MFGWKGYDIDETMDYVGFVEERHGVWKARQAGAPQPWTGDPIVRFHKFTNVFRVLDPGSQYAVALGNDDAASPLDTLARLFFYRYTNLPATWEHLLEQLGDWPDSADFMAEPNHIFRILNAYRAKGNKVFSGAYVILPQPNRTGDKVAQAVALTRQVLLEQGSDFVRAKTPEQRFKVLRRTYGVGPFMAMQILTDWGYSQYGQDTENAFVVAGPGSIKGAKLVNPTIKPEQVIAEAATWWASRAHVTLPIGRSPSLMDVQNTFCEYSKYARFRNRGGLNDDRTYTPQHPGPQPKPVYPRSWL